MPELEDLFYQGGTLLLKRTKLTAAALNLIDHDGDPDNKLDKDGAGLPGASVAGDGKKRREGRCRGRSC